MRRLQPLVQTAALLLLILALAAPAGAQEGGDALDRELAAVLERLRSSLEGVRTVSADMTQEQRLAVLREPRVSRGRLLFRRPDRLRWEITAPERAGFVIAGDTGRHWGAGGETSAVPFEAGGDGALAAFARQLLSWMTGDFGRLAEGSRLRLLGDRPVRLELVPAAPAGRAPVRRVTVTFAPDDRSVRLVEIVDRDGDLTRLTFSGVVINGPAGDDRF